VVVSAVMVDIYNDRQHKVEISDATWLYDDAQFDLVSYNVPPVRLLVPGEDLKVMRIRYSKDTMFIKVEDSHGKTGWIINDNKILLSGG